MESWRGCGDGNTSLSHSLWILRGWSCLPQLVGSCYPTIRDAAQRHIWAEGAIISTEAKQWFAVAWRKEGTRHEEDECTWTHAHPDNAVVKDWEHPGKKTLVFCSFMTPAPLSCIDGHSVCCVEAAGASHCHIHQKQLCIKQTHIEGMGRKGQLRTYSIMVPCLLHNQLAELEKLHCYPQPQLIYIIRKSNVITIVPYG